MKARKQYWKVSSDHYTPLAALLALALLTTLLIAPPPARATIPSTVSGATLRASFTVNSTADTFDAELGDGTCDDGTGICTLRAAIEETNSLEGADTINFDPAVFPPEAPATIWPASDLPPLADLDAGTTIDGSGAGVIVDGNDDPNLLFGLTLVSDNNVLRGLQIQRFPGDGVFIGENGNTVEYCYIGTDAAGNDLGNGWNGVNIQPLEETGGSNTVGPGNVIGFNQLDGVMVMGSNNVVQGNYIGTDAAGNDLGNSENGVYVFALLETEGANTVGPGNVIGFNDFDGVVIWGSDNVVQGNYIGTDAAGNDLGNGANGVDIQSIDGSGGPNTVGPGNIIGFNDADGVIIWGSGNVVHGNYIGTDAMGANLGNGLDGVGIHSWAAPDGALNRVGPDNFMAFNGGAGVYVDGDDADGNTITRNAIFTNTALGIDLYDEDDLWPGVTPNDPDDADTGPNEQLNFPVVISATTASVIGTACADCTVEVFVTDVDPSGYGEGKTFVGSGAADGAGNFNVAVSGVQAEEWVTATATDGDGNTSEFSANVQVVQGPTPPPTYTPTPTGTPPPTYTPTPTATTTTTPSLTPTATVTGRVYLPILLKGWWGD
jgi:CSLREA domain-containing protein